MDAEHAEHADGVPANLDSVMADAGDSPDGDLSDLIDDAEEQAEAHAKAEKEKERQKGGPFLSTSPEEQGQGPDSSYVPTQEQTGAQHGQDASLDDSFDAPSQAVLAGLRILRNDEQREERHRQAVANFHGSDDPGSPGKSPPQAPRRTKGKTGYELKAVRAAETYLASGGSPGVLDQHEKGSAATAAKMKAAAFYEEDEDDDRDEEEEPRPSHIPETGADPEYDAMRTQAEGTTRGQFASPGKPAAAAADDTRDRPERRNLARSARNGETVPSAAVAAAPLALCVEEGEEDHHRHGQLCDDLLHHEDRSPRRLQRQVRRDGAPPEGPWRQGKTALSYLRAPELVEEFLRLEKLYPEPAYRSPLPCPRRTLRFPLEMSWGSGQRWPAEFADDRKVTAAVAAAMEDAGGTVQPAVEGVGNDGVAAAARMAELNGEEQVRAVRARRPTQRAQEAASLS